MVRIASASFLMDDSPHTVELNLQRAIKYIHDASTAGANIVCLPETVTTNGVPDMMTAIDDSWLTLFTAAAIENSITVIAPFYVRDGGRIYNQASILGPMGNVFGFYRKVQPTGAESKYVTPGSEFPIIDLGFAKIAIMICMDIYFPEIARIYAMKGAEILFWPTTTHGPSQSGLESQLRSRAIDNSIAVVESNLAGHPPYAPYRGRFYPGNARIVDFNGDFIAQTGRREGLAVCEIDLDERRKTSDIVLIHDPDDTRADIEALARMDLYAQEYASISLTQHRFYDSLSK